MNIKNKLTLIISGLTALAVCVVILIFFLAFNPFKINDPISLQVIDMELYEGEIKPITYMISNDKAQVVFESSNSNIVSVQNQGLKAVGAGHANVKVTASFGEEEIIRTFQVIVLQRPIEKVTYDYSVACIRDCDYSDGTLLTQSREAVFNIDIYQNNSLLSQKLDMVVTATNGISVHKEVTKFILTPVQNGVVSFFIPSLNYSFSLVLKKY